MRTDSALKCMNVPEDKTNELLWPKLLKITLVVIKIYVSDYYFKIFFYIWGCSLVKVSHNEGSRLLM